jgi:hypothetical protein
VNKPRWMLAIFALLLPAIGAAQNPELSLPDFKSSAHNATSSVNISLGPWLLHTVGSLIDDHDADGAAAKRLFAGIESIRVRTYQFDSDAFPSAAIDSVRRQLEGPGWSQLLQSRDRNQGEGVEIYIMTERDRTKGFALLATEPREFTIINIVGSIRLEDLPRLEQRLQLPSVKWPASETTHENGARAAVL